MKPLLALTFLLGSLAFSGAATTINAVNKFCYGANLGWLDWRGATAQSFELPWMEKRITLSSSPQTIRSQR